MLSGTRRKLFSYISTEGIKFVWLEDESFFVFEFKINNNVSINNIERTVLSPQSHQKVILTRELFAKLT